ncbi:MAG: dephospho-CoA kinase [Actinomycetota bacterium]|nr:dephospho-CoA kinase [Actinomycetota bacterium]
MFTYVIAVTGGIGVGKSTVSSQLSELGAHVIDVDRLGHQVLDKGMREHRQVIEEFGKEILKEDEQIDRAKLGEVVFSDPERLNQLESITHPGINKLLFQRLSKIENPVTVLDMAVLVEKPLAQLEGNPLYQRVIVVESAMKYRETRLRERGLTKSEIRSRIASQATDEQRREVADSIVVNNGTIDELKHQVGEVWEQIQVWRHERG